MRAVVEQDLCPVPVNKGITQIEGTQPTGPRVVVPVGSFSRGFYFLGFGGWAAALPFCPF